MRVLVWLLCLCVSSWVAPVYAATGDDLKEGTAVTVSGITITGLTGIVQANGASAATAITDSSTVGQVFRVTGASTYGWGAVDLADTDAVTGILPGANGGTGNGFFAVSGPTTSLKTFTLPDASATVLTDNAAVTSAQVEAELRTQVQCFAIDPTVAATGEAQFRWGYPITLTEIRCDTDAGTVATTNLEERAPTTPNTAGTATLTTALTCDTNSETGTTFTNSAIDAWDPVALVYGTVTTATILRLCAEFTID